MSSLYQGANATAKSAIGWSTKKRAFTAAGGKVCLAGVHPTIKAVFYPKYKYSLAKLGPTTPRSENSKDAKITKFKPGKMAGSFSDREIVKITKLVLKYAIPLTVFTNEVDKKDYLKKHDQNITKCDKGMIKTKVSIATKSILRVLMKLGLTMQGAQVRVGDAQLGIATAVDLVCFDSAGRVVICENKVGYSGYYLQHGPTPMQHLGINDCVYHQNQLQLFVTFELYRRTFPGVAMGEPLLIRASSTGVDIFPIEGFIKEKAHIIFKALSNRMKK